jgi:hypothetical protein
MRRLLLGALLMAACGGDSPRGPIADPAVFLAELPVVECEHLARCGEYGSVDECAAIRAQLPTTGHWRYPAHEYDPRIVAAVARGTVVYSPSRAGQCLDAIADRSCAIYASDPAAGVCADVLVGTVPEGAVPAYAFECISGHQTGQDCGSLACCGTSCAPPPLGEPGLGAPCDERTSCRQGLRCDDDVCVDGADLGEPCRLLECRGGLVCVGGRCATDVSDETCWPGPEGVECRRLGETCGVDYRCHRYRRAGESCNDASEWCDRGAVCDFERGRCLGVAGPGEPCFDLFYGPFCAEGLYCSASDDREHPVCRPWRANGEACPNDYVCASKHCDRPTERCAPLPTCP